MLITGLMMTAIFLLKKEFFAGILSVFVTIVDSIFFFSLLHKIPFGGALVTGNCCYPVHNLCNLYRGAEGALPGTQPHEPGFVF